MSIVLKKFEVLWADYQIAEKKAAQDVSISKHLQVCIWPLLTFCLEQMVRLAENEFTNPLDTRVAQSIGKLVKLPLRTHLIERGFHDCRVSERASSANVLQELARWAALSNSTLLKDNDWLADIMGI